MQRAEQKRPFDRLFLVQDMILWQPRIITGWAHLAHAYNTSLRLRASQRAWEIRADIDKAGPENAAFDLATILLRQGRWDEALPHAQAALDGLRAKGQRNAWFDLLLARLLVHAKRYGDALRVLDGIGGGLNGNGTYWRARARALDGLGRSAEASQARARLQVLVGEAKRR
jgi:predicted Zn-dependent protease